MSCCVFDVIFGRESRTGTEHAHPKCFIVVAIFFCVLVVKKENSIMGVVG